MITPNNNTQAAQQATQQQTPAPIASGVSAAPAPAPAAPIAVLPAAPAPAPAAAHPFWSGFSWDKVLKALEVAAQIAPVVVAIATKQNPAATLEASQYSQVAGAILGAADQNAGQ